ncbi:sodium:proton antiporter [Streptomyces sp. NPDC050738]|uniref:cation:proton antiporter n=1 Tax=Streptomyces sp. NPDC050738 TaxID=3154744 RepID=UPI00341596E6
MELTLIAVVGVISLVAVAAFSERLGLAAPLSLVIVGIGLSFVPGVPHPDVEPEWILAGVLPPLLYSAAVTMPVVDFRRNIRPITSLAVVLVVVTTLGTGWLFHWLLPSIGWPAAFALGAVISPTDAVAATAVGRKLGLPHRLLTLLEGEGLVNDASALVLLRSAVAAFAGTVSVWSVAGKFVYAVVVAIAVGLVVGLLNVRVRALFKDPVLNTAISFVVPFIAYLPAEEFDASGVLAVVVAGIVTGHESPRRLRAQDRLAEATNWRTLSFLLENGMFLLMGLSVKTLVDEVGDTGPSFARTLGIGLLAAATAVVLRMVYVVPLIASSRREQRRAADAKPRVEQMRDDLQSGELTARSPQGPRSEKWMERVERRITRVSANLDFSLNETLGWRGGVVLAWSGMRGAITLAAAQTLPQDTPLRPQLILIAFVVAATTLLLQGLSLPWVIRRVKIPADDPERLRDDFTHLLTELRETVVAVLDDPGTTTADGTPYDPRVVAHIRANNRLLAHDKSRPSRERTPDTDVRDHQYLQLSLRLLDAETAHVLKARASGAYSSRALNRIQNAIDVEAAQLQQIQATSRDL